MTETTNEPVDVEAFLDRGKRVRRAVDVFTRTDILADIDRLEKELRTIQSVPEADRSMGDGDGSSLVAQIEALGLEVDKSRIELSVSFIDEEEREAIHDEVKAELKDEADAAAKKAANDARESCDRAEIKDRREVDQVVRRMTTEAAKKVIDREVGFRAIAACIVEPQMTVDQVRRLYKIIGDSQFELIRQAWLRASAEAPVVTVPKSQTPSLSPETSASS